MVYDCCVIRNLKRNVIVWKLIFHFSLLLQHHTVFFYIWYLSKKMLLISCLIACCLFFHASLSKPSGTTWLFPICFMSRLPTRTGPHQEFLMSGAWKASPGSCWPRPGSWLFLEGPNPSNSTKKKLACNVCFRSKQLCKSFKGTEGNLAWSRAL